MPYTVDFSYDVITHTFTPITVRYNLKTHEMKVYKNGEYLYSKLFDALFTVVEYYKELKHIHQSNKVLEQFKNE